MKTNADLIKQIYDLKKQICLDDDALLSLILTEASTEHLNFIINLLQIYSIQEFLEMDLGATHYEIIDVLNRIFKITNDVYKDALIQVNTKLEACYHFIRNKSKDLDIDELLQIMETDTIPSYEKVDNYYVRILDEIKN